ncbi:hypothetical protein UH38_22020 [Aliterella atlantica CENA595]|uniref:Uncharacterized protein n=1 Tax=Aliterella atlantica CENA595 TaxID=1618023 RepID=A0A0D8ZMW5_9CYAN|nr:hypothetical protein UH38_22020 [Aliterella atlantica CENA595]
MRKLASIMFDTPNSIQWLILCDRVSSLAQMRFCIYNLLVDGGFLFVRAKSCDSESIKHLFIINSEGEFV